MTLLIEFTFFFMINMKVNDILQKVKFRNYPIIILPNITTGSISVLPAAWKIH